MNKLIILLTFLLLSGCSITYSDDSVFSRHRVIAFENLNPDFNELKSNSLYSISFLNTYSGQVTNNMLFSCQNIKNIKVGDHYYFSISRMDSAFAERHIEITNLSEVLCEKDKNT